MNQTQKSSLSKAHYEAPKIDFIQILCNDIITASKPGDENQGEWDPQSIDL